VDLTLAIQQVIGDLRPMPLYILGASCISSSTTAFRRRAVSWKARFAYIRE